VEVHLPPFWEQYINDENSVELIRTDTLPLVISLNGHALNEFRPEEHSLVPEQVPRRTQLSAAKRRSKLSYLIFAMKRWKSMR
jgi:hypothetical protein